MEIRLAREKDLPGINEIYNQAVRQGFCTAHLVPLTLTESMEWFRVHDPGTFPVFVAMSGNRVEGWVSIGAYRQDRQALAHVAEVSYYVDKDVRGRGIGSGLVEHAIRMAPQFGFSILIAILLSKNPASISLLKKHGFSCWGTMPGIAIIKDQLADHLYYGLKLT
ncbi:MAG: N-acetyltransferase family protein [Bacteroidota bacterium]